MRSWTSRTVALLSLAAAACSTPGARVRAIETSNVEPPNVPATRPSSAAPPSASAASTQPGDAESDAEVAEALKRVAAARHLPIKHPVHGRRLGRDELLVQLKKKMREEIPEGVIRLQGEAYRSLELVPVDYDFQKGLLDLLQSQIAGYYDPEDKTMYLLDDLGDSMRDETLNHELIHALQDQSFDLGPLVKYHPGKGDEESAEQTLVEGDATSGMMDAAGTPALEIDEGLIANMFSLATEFSSVGVKTPAFVRDELVSPYIDGFKFVGQLRRHGGWTAVDDAFRQLPTTTEQVLHLDKFLKHEPAIVVPDPTIAALGDGWSPGFVDTMGELGLRYIFIDEGPKDMAIEAAAGWGGDRFVVAEKVNAPNDHVYALAMHVTMDTLKDGTELSAMLDYGLDGAHAKKTGGASCRDRTDLGPIAWMAKGKDAVVVAGPYRVHDQKIESASSCSDATKWAADVFAQK